MRLFISSHILPPTEVLSQDTWKIIARSLTDIQDRQQIDASSSVIAPVHWKRKKKERWSDIKKNPWIHWRDYSHSRLQRNYQGLAFFQDLGLRMV